MHRTSLRNAFVVGAFACVALVASGLMTTKAVSPQPSPSAVTCAQYENGGGNFPPLPTSLDATCANIPLDMVGTPGQPSADAYGWLTFIALNWPVDPKTCAADPTQNIASATPAPTWLSYLTPDVVFPATGRPAGWCNTPTGLTTPKGALFGSNAAALGARRRVALAALPPKVRALAAKHPEVTLFLHQDAKSKDLITALKLQSRFHRGAKMARLLRSSRLKGILDATGQPVTDQNGRFVRYTVAMNLDEYGYIIAHRLWTSAGQTATGNLSFPPSGGAGSKGPVGAMEFKAAWKVLGNNDNPAHFFTQWAIVYNDANGAPSPGKNPVQVGLVGLHITHKTARQHNWLWATFEQTDIPTGFNNPKCPVAQCPPNVQTAASPYVELNPQGVPLNKPVQVVGVSPSTAGRLNPMFQKMLAGSPWAYYQEVSTQWEGNFPPGPKPAQLGNAVLETFVKQTIPYSCLNCHSFAYNSPGGNKADFSFQINAKQ